MKAGNQGWGWRWVRVWKTKLNWPRSGFSSVVSSDTDGEEKGLSNVWDDEDSVVVLMVVLMLQYTRLLSRLHY